MEKLCRPHALEKKLKMLHSCDLPRVFGINLIFWNFMQSTRIIFLCLMINVAIQNVTGAEKTDQVNPWQDSIIEKGFYPFDFIYDGQKADIFLRTCQKTEHKEKLGLGQKLTISWLDPKSNLNVTFEAIYYKDFYAVDWIMYFENVGNANTGIIENIQVLKYDFTDPLAQQEMYRLYKTNGAPANPTDFETSCIALSKSDTQVMGAGGGRSSNKDLPFFKVEGSSGSIIFAVGWTGQWQSRVQCQPDGALQIQAGLEKTHFRLYPGEKVRMPRIVALRTDGDTQNCNALFRQLVYKYYTATRSGEKMLPIPFCNTCFTRGGLWLNETTAANQISLIKAYSKLGVEALITDAGWFEGGWPAGAGNWVPRKDNYPDGMIPVAAAAKQHNMVYGLWFEPERVVAGTWLHKNRSQWLLKREGDASTYLLNFGLPEVQAYFFNIVKEYMNLPGFGVYRQDFNMDPLPYWQNNDATDRQGITEIKYIQGLYAYWDRLASTWPDSFREGCASGGRRIDLESIMRLHAHQKTDFWFDNETDQSSIFGLSQYLPNNVIVAHLCRLDDYSFHSAMASSLCLGWIADDPAFDSARGKHILDEYKKVRELLVGAWYPLTENSRDEKAWFASQYHRPDLEKGMIIVFRRPQSNYQKMQVNLRAIDQNAMYIVHSHLADQDIKVKGETLMNNFAITLSQRRQSDLITYKKDQ